MMASKSWLVRSLTFALLTAAIAAAPVSAQALPPHDPSRILVGFPASTSETDRAAVHAVVGGRVERSFEDIRVDLVRIPAGLTPLRTIERYEADARVAYAEPNWIQRLDSIPNDTSFRNLWGLHNTGQFLGYSSDADIDGPEGWDIGYGSGSFPNAGGIRVGIIDSGIDGGHVELSGKVVACGSSLDGYGTISGGCADDAGHGTHVAGTIGAKGNNSAGIIGVAPDVEFVIAKTFNSQGQAYQSDSIGALNWMRTSTGAKVVNMSFGGPHSSSFQSAVSAASSAGMLLVASAGNSGNTSTQYPAGYAEVISVAAIDGDDTRAYFSNMNADVELAAPGVEIYSTVPGGYDWYQGTSMAAPHVTGVGALVMSASGVDGATARSLLTTTAVDLGASGRDSSYGFGRVNLADALNASPLKPQIAAPAEGAILGSTSLTVSGTGRANKPLAVREGTQTLATTTIGSNEAWSVTVSLAEGSHSITAVVDPGTTGEKASSPRTLTIDLTAPAAPSFTSPAPGATVTGTSVTVTGAAEPFAEVSIRENGNLLGTAVTTSGGGWSRTLAVSEGLHTITAAARDRAGNTGPSASLSFRLAIPPPAPAVVYPEEATQVAGGTPVTFTGSALSAVEVRIRDEGAIVATASVAPDGTWTTTAPLADGAHTIAASSVDGDGDEGAAATRSFLVGGAPNVELITPGEGHFVSSEVSFTGRALANASIRIAKNGVTLATGSADAEGTFAIVKTMPQGRHTVAVTATSAGVAGPVVMRTFTVDTMAPIVRITTATNGVYTPLHTIKIVGTATDDKRLGRIELTYDRVALGDYPPEVVPCTGCGTTSASWEHLPQIAPGIYDVIAIAYDEAGNASIPRTIRIVVS